MRQAGKGAPACPSPFLISAPSHRTRYSSVNLLAAYPIQTTKRRDVPCAPANQCARQAHEAHHSSRTTVLVPASETDTMSGPRLSPVALLCSMCAASQRGKVPLCQQRQYTFLLPGSILSCARREVRKNR